MRGAATATSFARPKRAAALAATLASGALGLALFAAPTRAAAALGSGAGGTSASGRLPTRPKRRGAHSASRRHRRHGHRGARETGGASALPPAPPGHAPVVGHTRPLRYSGPVYELAASGQVVPYQPPALASGVADESGGAPADVTVPGKPKLLVPGRRARFVDGMAAAPMEAPPAVQAMIWAANQIIGRPYVYGGGHQSFRSAGYDCSGTVSFALHGAGLLETPEDSSELEAFGGRGVGAWVTIFANAGHAYMDIAGLRLDTSPAEDPSGLPGPRWRPLRETNAGYVVRHPAGL